MATMFSGAAPTLLDRLIGWANPRQGLARHFDRLRLARAYEAASPRDGWKPRRPGASANADHMADAATIRTRARAHELLDERLEQPEARAELNSLRAAWPEGAPFPFE